MTNVERARGAEMAGEAGGVRLAQIGCGGRAMHLIGAIRPIVEPIVCCDLDPERAGAMRDRFGFHAVSADALAAASDPAVELISVVLPPDEHPAMVQQLVSLGKPIVVEKPLAVFEEPAVQTVEVIRRFGTPVAIGCQYRYHPWARAMVSILRQGRIGEVYTVHLEHSYFNTSGKNYPWLKCHERYLTSSMNCHYYDLLRFLLEDEVDRVYAYVGQAPDRRIRPDEMTGDTRSIAILHLRRGAVANVFTQEETRGGTPAWPLRLTLCGTKGSLFYESRPGEGPRLEIYEDATGERAVVPLEPNPPAANLLLVQEFLAAAREKREPPTDAADHLNTLAVGFACYESGASGGVVKVRHHGTPRYG